MRELEELAGQLESLREQIARSRRGHKRARLPAELWEQGASWTKKLGAYRASRALGVSYESLRSRRGGNQARGFVEFSGAQLMDAGTGTVIELADATGARLSIRLGAGQTVEAPAVVTAFLGARR